MLLWTFPGSDGSVSVKAAKGVYTGLVHNLHDLEIVDSKESSDSEIDS